MDLAAAGLREQPFRTHGKPVSIVAYASQSRALTEILECCSRPTGLALLQGPPLSGKSTIVRLLVEQLDDDRAYAVVDGNNVNTTGLLETVLRQFGYEVDFSSNSELLAMLRMFALHQAAHHEAPLLVVENADGLNPSALRALCELADLRVRQTRALKIVLVSNRSLEAIIASPAMNAIAIRVCADLHLRPMTSEEARDYLHSKLRAAGSKDPDCVFPDAVCAELWDASGGWPGILDRIALLALAKADMLPVTVDAVERPVLPTGTWDRDSIAGLDEAAADLPAPPRLFVSHNGKTTQTVSFHRPRLLIGRSEHNDISISSKFVSRHHLLLVRHGNATFMMDLNSTNGTFVNSRRVSNHLLADNDVITVGHHRIKFSYPHATMDGEFAGLDFSDTAIMKTLDDMRRLLAQENTEILPIATEDLPTAGGKP